MTKQQLREAIRRIINQELNEEMKTKSVSNPNAGKWRIVNEKTGSPMTKEFYNSKEEAMDAVRALGKTNAAGIKIIQLKDTMDVYTKGLDESLTDTERDELDHIEDELKHKVKTDSIISKKMVDRYKELIAKKKMSENAPAPSKPAEKPGPAIAPGKPGEKEGPRRPLGNPNVSPAPKAIKATMKEAEMLKKVIQRFKAKKNA
jgi:hypothetical protein